MTQESKHPTPDDQRQSESELFVMVKKIQQHLIFLERKIDTLINQSPARSHRDGRFSKSSGPYSHSHRSGRERPEHRLRPGEHPMKKHPFDRSGEGGHRPFFSKKKGFFRHEEN